MAKLLKLRRGTTSQHSSFTGAEGEVTVDTNKDTLVIHDGSTAGGHPVAAENMANVSSVNLLSRIGTGTIAHAKLANDCIDGDNIADNAVDSEHYTDGSIDHEHLANDCIDGDNIQDDVVNSEHIAAGAIDLEHMSSESVDEDNLHISNAGSNGQFLSKQSGNTGGLTWATVNGTTINNNSDNRIVTGSSTANTLNAKSDLTWGGSILTATADSSSDAEIKLIADNGDDNGDYWKLQTSQSDNYFRVYDYGQGSWIERLKIDTAGKLYATTFQGIGTDLTSLNASNLGSGTVASARVSGAYTGITGVGTLTSLNTSGTFTEDINTLTTNSPVINCSLGNYFKITINSSCTFSFTNDPSSKAYGCVVEVNHDGGTISWPSELKWSTDAPPSLTTGKTHLFFFTTNDSGSRWRGAYQVDYTD